MTQNPGGDEGKSSDPVTVGNGPDPGPAPSARSFDPKLLELFVCPQTRTTLAYDSVRQELISRAARLAFPIRDGVPILVREEARRLDDPA